MRNYLCVEWERSLREIESLIHSSVQVLNRDDSAPGPLGLAPSSRLRSLARAIHSDAREVSRTDDLEIFHIRRIVEQEMPDSRSLVNAIPRRHQSLLPFVHELRPALEHVNDVELGVVNMPARSCFGFSVGTDEVCYHLSFRCLRDPKVAINKEIAQAATLERCIARFDMRKVSCRSHFRTDKVGKTLSDRREPWPEQCVQEARIPKSVTCAHLRALRLVPQGSGQPCCTSRSTP